MEYDSICALTKGESHIKSHTPCEDYGLVFNNNTVKVFALSDGHGDKSCPRSNIGSKKACEIAVQQLRNFAEQLEDMDSPIREENASFSSHLVAADAFEQEAMVRHLVVSIIGEWAHEVASDIAMKPLEEDERNGCSEYYLGLYDNGMRLDHIYGATLIAGLITPFYLLLIQQGDGRCDVFYEDASVSQPIPWDSRCTANVTSSLCDEDAITATRYCVVDLVKRPVMAVLAGSDGVEDAYFSMEGTHNFYRSILLKAADSSVKETESWLKSFLPEFSRSGTNGYGSQDDVTVCGFIDADMVRRQADTIRNECEIVSIRSRLASAQDRLDSMETGKLEYLQRLAQKALDDEKNANELVKSLRLRIDNERLYLATVNYLTTADEVLAIKEGSKKSIIGKALHEAQLRFGKLLARGMHSISSLELQFKRAQDRYKETLEIVNFAQKELHDYEERKRQLMNLVNQYQSELDALTSNQTKRDDSLAMNDCEEQGYSRDCEHDADCLEDTLERPAIIVDSPRKRSTHRPVSDVPEV